MRIVKPYAAGLPIDRLWHSGRPRWVVLLVLGTLVTSIGGVAASVLASVDRQRLGLQSQIRSAQDTVEGQSKERHSAAALPSTDFIQKLPAPIDLQAALSTLQRSTAEAGVALVGVQLQQRATTKELLPRVDLNVSLRGSYPKLQKVLADALGRYPNVTLLRASMRRAGAPDQVEASLSLALWGAPDLEQRNSRNAPIADAASLPARAVR